jgi:hypothetical protein
MKKFKNIKEQRTPMSKKPGIIDEGKYEKLSFVEKWRYLCEKMDEIDRRVRSLIREKEKR